MSEMSGIIKNIQFLLGPPVFENEEEKTRNARVLNNLLNGILAVLLIPVLLGLPFVYVRKMETAIIILFLFLVTAVSRVVMFKGFVRKASQFLLVALWGIFMMMIVLGDGMRDFRFIFIISITVVAGLLLGKRAVVIISAASAAAGLIITICESNGYLPIFYFSTPPMARWIELFIALFLTATTLHYAIKSRDDALAAAREQLEERRRAEEKLERSNQRFSKVFHSSPAPTVISSIAEGRYLAVNDQWCRMMGYSRDELIGRTSHELAMWPYPEERNALIEKYSRQEFCRGELIHMRTKSGEIRNILCSADVIKYEEENVLLSLFFDVTERKKVEDAMRRSEQKYRFLAEKMNDMIWTIDLNFKTTFVTPSVENLLGYTPEERMQQEARDQMTPSSYDRALERLAAELQWEQKPGIDPERAVTINIEYYHKNGSTVWMENKVSAIRDDKGSIIGIYGVSRDITERRRTEEERRMLQERLQRAEKMEALGTLAGGVAHDLNNVLGVLVGYSELLLMETPEGNPLRRHTSNILLGGRRAAAIIQDLLTLARRGMVNKETMNLNHVTNLFLESPEFELLKAHHPGVVFKVDMDDRLLNIKGSPAHLGKILMNLISNAAEAISGLGEISIRTGNRYVDKPIPGYENTKEGEYAVLAVSDTGSGIPAAELGRIFEPFFTKKVMGRSGTGLGLAVVWSTVKDHNGYIDVHSAEGKGTVFTLYFPITRAELVKEEAVITEDAYMGRGEKILIVDDVREQRELAHDILTEMGYKADTVASGEEAVEYVKVHSVDLVILDMIMDPGIDGLETYQRIIEAKPESRAIIVSGFSETKRVKEAIKKGVGAYVRKPYILEEIGLAVRQELDRPPRH